MQALPKPSSRHVARCSLASLRISTRLLCIFAETIAMDLLPGPTRVNPQAMLQSIPGCTDNNAWMRALALHACEVDSALSRRRHTIVRRGPCAFPHRRCLDTASAPANTTSQALRLRRYVGGVDDVGGGFSPQFLSSSPNALFFLS